MKTGNRIGRAVVVVFAAVAALALFACGGGGGSDPAPAGVAVVSTGTMTKGSVIVNGVRFEDTLANITADDTPKTAAFLQTGMTVKVKGTRNDDGVTGRADRIEVENEVRGLVTAKTADTLTVLGVTIFVDGATVFANVTNLAAIVAGTDTVEVHGQRDAAGNLRATRVELLGAGAVDEIKGIVATKTGTDAGTFTLRGSSLTFSYDTTDQTPSTVIVGGAAFVVGDLVEVHLNGALAVRIELEEAEDSEFDPVEGQEVEVEGFISGFNGHPGHFFVNDREVQTNNLTRFEGGVAADLANNVKVEAEGHLVAGVLEVEKITFKDTVRIESNAQSASGSSAPTNFTVLGKTVLITSATERNLALPIGIGTGVKVRGFVNPDGSITATRIDGISPVASDRHILQGPVSSFNLTARTMVILGITIDASTSSLEPHDIQNDNDQVITLDQFFASLIADRTIVKARGSFNAGTITANQIEIE